MLRRRALLAISVLLPVSSGCLARMVGEQGKTVPLRVINNFSQRKCLTVTFSEEDSNDTLFSKTITLGPSQDRTYEVEPINLQSRYIVSFEVGDQAGEELVTGSEVCVVELSIGENGRAGMIISVSDESTSTE